MRVGGWEVESELGRGGMGVVYRARDARGRNAALKVVTLGALEPERLIRFEREAEALRRLDHPGLVRILDAGREGGGPWLAMELVPGENLARKLEREGAFAPADAAWIVARVARGLEHAHARAVLHRDVKPANVLLRPDGEPVLTDFGLAGLLAEAGPERITASGQVLGTPGYLAPEQARGDRARVGPAADVYGLGATLFALLTGQPPFQGPQLVPVLAAILRQPAPSPRALRPGLDPRLCAIVDRCLAKEPAERWQTAGALAAALERWLAGPPASRTRPARTAALAVLAICSLAAWRTWPSPTPTPPLPAPPAPVTTAAPTRPTRPAAGLEWELWRHRDRGAAWEQAIRARRLGGDPLAAARLLRAGCPVALVEEEEATGQALRERARSLPPLEALEALDWSVAVWPTADAYRQGVAVYKLLGDYSNALAVAERLCKKDPSHRDGRVMRAWILLDRDPEAGLHAVEALLDDEALRPLAMAMTSEGRRLQGDLEGALEAARQACQALPDDDTPWLLQALALADLGRQDEAHAACREALARVSSSAAVPPLGAKLLRELEHFVDGPPSAVPAARGPSVQGILAAARGDDAQARRSLDEAVRLDPGCVAARIARGRLALERGRADEALADAQAAVEQARGGPGAWAAKALEARALTILRRPEATAASAEAERLAPAIPEARIERGARLLALGDPRGARAELEQAVVEDPLLGRGWAYLGEACGELGDEDGEVAAIRSAVTCQSGDLRVRLRAERLADRLLARGRAHRARGDLASAERDLEALVVLRYRSWAGWIELSQVLEARGELRAARRAAEVALDTVDGEEQRAMTVALVSRLGWATDPLVGLLAAQRAVEKGDRSHALLHRVELLLRLGWVDEALAAGADAVSLAPAAPEGHLAQAKALRGAGRSAEANDALQRALERAGPKREAVLRDWEAPE